MPESEFAKYQVAFDAALEKPGWRLVPMEKDGPLSTAAHRADAEQRHRKLLVNAIRNGTLTTYSHANTPLEGAEAEWSSARVRLDDVVEYVSAVISDPVRIGKSGMPFPR
jgi:hypothetical protein